MNIIKYMYTRATKDVVDTMSHLSNHTYIIPDLLQDEDIQRMFNYKCHEDPSNQKWLTGKNGDSLEYIVFIETENRKNEYYEHLCNLNKYIKNNEH